ncbi:MAG TPA: 6-phosphogluconolactonase [Solirubrobacteraceae bacterium]|nr:6-phosphogluconolactonase [Solirubrobacteraceae bacterium]
MTAAPTIIREADYSAVSVAAAALFAERVGGALAERGVAHVALDGGTTPERTYVLISLPSWEGVELWFGDERCVGPEDPDSNYRMVAATLLGHARGAVVHRIVGELGGEAAASAYEQELRSRLPAGSDAVPVFDLVLLGIGEDGHTASLFPGNPALDARGVACVAVHDAPKPPPDRVSLSLEVLRAARSCVLLASGTGKASALAKALGEPTAAVPSSLLARERLTVIADADALSETGIA